jgi:hypothetical protein
VNVGAEYGAKLGMGIAGAALGGGATKHPVGVAIGGLLGTLIGHAFDVTVVPRCPTCGLVLQLIGPAL